MLVRQMFWSKKQLFLLQIVVTLKIVHSIMLNDSPNNRTRSIHLGTSKTIAFASALILAVFRYISLALLLLLSLNSICTWGESSDAEIVPQQISSGTTPCAVKPSYPLCWRPREATFWHHACAKLMRAARCAMSWATTSVYEVTVISTYLGCIFALPSARFKSYHAIIK